MLTMLVSYRTVVCRSANPRRAAVVNYFADGTTCHSEEPLLKGVPRFRHGEALSGQFFPLLFDPKTMT